MELTENQVKQILSFLKDQIKIKVKTRVDEDFLKIRVELLVDKEIFSTAEDCVRIKIKNF